MLGLIAGILLAILVVLLDLYLWNRGKSITEHTIRGVQKYTTSKAMINIPPTEADEALKTIFNINDELGRDTKLDEIL